MATARRILLVDDDPSLTVLANEFLQGAFPHLQIDQISTAAGLAQALDTGGFDLVITDYRLGWSDGLEVLRRVKARCPDCPVIMFTATGSEEIAVEAMKAGLDDYVLKSPKHIGRFTASVRHVLDQAEQRRIAQETEGRYRSLVDDVLESSAVGVLVLDADFRVVWVNAALEGFFGLRREDLIGLDKRTLIGQRIKHLFENPDRFSEKILATYDDNTYVEQFECRVRPSADRPERWLEHWSQPIRSGLYAGGRVEHYYDITARKRAENSLFRMASFLQMNPGPIIETDSTPAVAYMNPKAEQLFPDLSALGPAHPLLKGIQESMKRLLCRGGQDTLIVFDVTVADRSYELSGWCIGGGEHFWFSGNDITARKQAEEALHFSTQQFRSAFEDATIGMALVAPDGRWLKVNRALCELTGYSAEELLVKTFQDITYPDDLERDLEYVRQMLAGERRTYQMEKRYYHKLGHVVWVLLSVSLVRSADGQPSHFISQIQNITARKQAEEALRQANEALQAIVQSSPVATTVLNRDGIVQMWNPAAERLFGWSSDEVVGRPLPTVPDEKREEHRALRERVLRNEAFRDVEAVRRKKDGSLVTISLSTAPLSDAQGRIVGILGLMADVTLRKQMEWQAGRLERMAAMGLLIGGVAHQIKNPLFVVTGHVQLLRDKLAHREYDGLERDLQKIEAAAQRASAVVQRFLALGKPLEQQQQCSIAAILDEALDFLANELVRNQIRVRTEIARDLPAVRGNRPYLREAFLNLALNAMQAMAEAHGQGTLTVTAQISAVGSQPLTSAEKLSAISHQPSASEKQWIEVRITDDGPGIAPEHRPKLFEPFFSTKPPEQGTGLGLWMVRTVLMGLGGTVTCDTEVGKGATFIVRLPVAGN
ncbi:MAG: PAS domain S-box protein [Nitrospira sp.]|nr:PAS domain S-box protein [Nitrospira sp.]